MSNFQVVSPAYEGVINQAVLLIAREEDLFVIDSAPDDSEPIPMLPGRTYTLGTTYMCAFDTGPSIVTVESADWLEFISYAQAWKNNTRLRLSSSAADKAMDPNYLAIVGMGDRAVPHILQQMRSELELGRVDHWFVALWAITKANPVPEASRGKVKEMAKAWLAWGEDKGLVSAGLGTIFSPAW